jgi:hypothetical protein
MYRALKPIYRQSGEYGPGISRAGNRNNLVKEESFRVEWETLGLAADMPEAKKLYGGSPVLEKVKP